MSDETKKMIADASEARKTRDAAGRDLDKIHEEMIAEICAAAPDGWVLKTMGPDILRHVFAENSSGASFAEIVAHALAFYGHATTLFRPRAGETPREHEVRVRKWIGDRWREDLHVQQRTG